MIPVPADELAHQIEAPRDADEVRDLRDRRERARDLLDVGGVGERDAQPRQPAEAQRVRVADRDHADEVLVDEAREPGRDRTLGHARALPDVAERGAPVVLQLSDQHPVHRVELCRRAANAARLGRYGRVAAVRPAELLAQEA